MPGLPENNHPREPVRGFSESEQSPEKYEPSFVDSRYSILDSNRGTWQNGMDRRAKVAL
jgi:hypothetical protein